MRKDNIEQQFSSVITVFINLLFITGIDLYLSIMLLVCFFLYIIKSLEEQQCCWTINNSTTDFLLVAFLCIVLLQ